MNRDNHASFSLGENLTALERRVLSSIEPSELVELLQALIRQRSDYPPGDCRAAVKVVSDKLAEVNLPFRVFSRQERQPNLIADWGRELPQADLLFHSHIDTVPA